MRIRRIFGSLAAICLVAACNLFPPAQQNTSAPTTVNTPSVAPSSVSPTPAPTPIPTPTVAPKLMISGSNVGTLVIGTSGYDAAAAYLASALGTPTQELVDRCELSGAEWKVMAWQGLRVSFDNKQTGTPLITWRLVLNVGVPDNVQLIEGLPTQISFAELKKRYPAIKLNDVFGTGGGPWVAEPLPELYYIWDEQSAETLSRIEGGDLLACE